MIAVFNYKYSRKEVINKIQRKHNDWFRMIPDTEEQEDDEIREYERPKQKESSIKKEEEKREEDLLALIIWDLPREI